MATSAEWATGYARQADADFKTFEAVQDLSIPECHRLLFLQMACEKLVKAHSAIEHAPCPHFELILISCPSYSSKNGRSISG